MSRMLNFFLTVVTITLFTIALWMICYIKDAKLDVHNVDRLIVVTNSTTTTTKYYIRNESTSPPLDMARARALIQEVCQKKNSNSVTVIGRPPRFFYSRKANILCCKAPKTGSSFWASIIMAIESNKSVERAFHMNRNAIHGNNEIEIGKLRNVNGKELKILVSRDPYTRLFSAFVDKYYLLGGLGRELQQALRKGPYIMNGGNCGYNVSFSEFLEFVASKAFQRVALNEHFLPILNLCDPCKVHYDMIIKQENLTKNTQYVLDRLQISNSKIPGIQHVLKSGRIKHTMYSLVSSYLSDYNIYRRDCPDRVSHFEKVWKTFHIQGYISTKVNFPGREFRKILRYDPEGITTLVLREMEKVHMSKQEKNIQREVAVSLAYAEVDEKTIEKIQQVYKMDFDMFGYDTRPPDKRPGAVT